MTTESEETQDSEQTAARRYVVEVMTQYLEEESDSINHRFVFAYTVSITNQGDRAGQLLNRHWIVTDAQGKEEHVRGPGVVGKQPWLEPSEGFRYTSGTVLTTPFGTMHGSYEFQTRQGERFEVSIPVFALSVPNIVH